MDCGAMKGLAGRRKIWSWRDGGGAIFAGGAGSRRGGAGSGSRAGKGAGKMKMGGAAAVSGVASVSGVSSVSGFYPSNSKCETTTISCRPEKRKEKMISQCGKEIRCNRGFIFHFATLRISGFYPRPFLPLLLFCFSLLGPGLFTACTGDPGLREQLADSEGDRGRLLVEAGRAAEAYRAYRRAWELEPGNSGYLYEAVRLSFSTGDMEWGLRGGRLLRDRLPENLMVLELLAYGYSLSGDFDRALVAYREIVSLRGNYLPALQNIALLFQEMDEPVAAYETMVEISREDAAGALPEPLPREFWVRLADLSRSFAGAAWADEETGTTEEVGLDRGVGLAGEAGDGGTDDGGAGDGGVGLDGGARRGGEDQDRAGFLERQRVRAEAVVKESSLLEEEIRWLRAALDAEPGLETEDGLEDGLEGDAESQASSEVPASTEEQEAQEQAQGQSQEQAQEQTGNETEKARKLTEAEKGREKLLLRLVRLLTRNEEIEAADNRFRELFSIPEELTTGSSEGEGSFSGEKYEKALSDLPKEIGGERKGFVLFEYAWLLLVEREDYVLGLPVLAFSLRSGFDDRDAVSALLADPLLFDSDVVRTIVTEELGPGWLSEADRSEGEGREEFE